jgi:hypothetical protein
LEVVVLVGDKSKLTGFYSNNELENKFEPHLTNIFNDIKIKDVPKKRPKPTNLTNAACAPRTRLRRT